MFDIISDHACTFVLAVGALSQMPTLWPVTTVFLLSFGVVNTVLSLVFLYWPLKSPNDFHLIDRAVWRINWSPAAKGLNTAGVVLAVAAGHPGAAFALAVAVLAVKVWSLRRVAGLITDRLPDQLPVR